MSPPYRRALSRVLVLTLAATSVTLLGPAAPAVADDIPKAPGHRLVGDYQGAPATAAPVAGQAPPQHPYLAPDGRSGMHADAAGSGRIWWVTRLGRVGTVDPRTSVIRSVRLAGEEIQNSFSVARDGVSLVSDHALYSFTATPDGTPRVQWRQTYDRGTGTKPGSVNQGSGKQRLRHRVGERRPLTLHGAQALHRQRAALLL